MGDVGCSVRFYISIKSCGDHIIRVVKRTAAKEHI